MHDAMVVEVCDGGESGSDKVGGIRLVVVALPTDAVEQFTTKSEVRDQVDCSLSACAAADIMRECGRTVVHRLEVIHQRQDVPVAHRDSLEDCNFVPYLAIHALALIWDLPATVDPPYVHVRPSVVC